MSKFTRLAALRHARILSPLDEGFAATLDRIVGGAAWEAVLGAAVASRAVSEGNVCVDLAALAGRALPAMVPGEPGSSEPCPSFARWRDAIAESPFVREGGEAAPLVLDARGRLYLRRYWEHERDVIAAIRERASGVEPVLDDAGLSAAIDRLFPRDSGRRSDVDWQRVAAMVAARRRFCVVTGGPGTGKTTTVVRILAILVEGLSASLGRAPRIAVLAPTGKAAARLAESIARQRSVLEVDERVRAAIPTSASTIHRALGSLGRDSGRFRYDSANPHPADVVVVDEASMVPLALMSRLVRAMRRSARLVLLGDRDQLASVEAGAVLGDVCNAGEAIPISRDLAADAARIAGERIVATATRAAGANGIGDAIVELVGSRRFDPERGIGALAAAVRAGEGERAVAILSGEGGRSVRMIRHPREGGLAPEIEKLVRTGWGPYAAATEPLPKLGAFDALRILSPLRVGPEGIEALNEAIEGVLGRAGMLAPASGHYAGRAILVTRNDYEARLFNGDVGIVVERGERRLGAAFLAPDGKSVRVVSTSLLPPHETAFAMTVHKSQGSEFDEVAVVLPRKATDLVTRELLYTAVTRAKSAVIIQGTRDDVVAAIGRRTVRSSGLRDALWGTTT
jgi:exodeoxyribonuclease V alpha subunit